MYWTTHSGDIILYIYSSVYNNCNTIEESIKSLEPLAPYKLFVVDNYSTDGTYEKLLNYKQITVIQKKCTLGKGRGLALDMVLNKAHNSDPVFYIDLDTVLTDKGIAYIKKSTRSLKPDIFFAIGNLGTVSTHRKVPWKNLIFAEEVEHAANAISSGVKLYYFDHNKIYDYVGDLGPNVSIAKRQFRYAKGFYKYIRLFRCLIDSERGYAFNGPIQFLNNSISKQKIEDSKKHLIPSLTGHGIAYFILYLTIYTTAFFIAMLLGVYRYDKNLTNQEYISTSELYIKLH